MSEHEASSARPEITPARRTRRVFLLQTGAAAAGLTLAARAGSASSMPKPVAVGGAVSSPFLLGWSDGALTSLRFAGDRYPTEYLQPGHRLGHVLATWRGDGGAWQTFDSASVAREQREMLPVLHQGTAARYRAGQGDGRGLQLDVRLETKGGVLRWSIGLTNTGPTAIEVGDLALPLPLHTLFEGGQPPTASVLKHSFISGDGSFLFWMRSNSVGPYLLMTPERGTSLEFWERLGGGKDHPSVYTVYVHSAARGAAVAAAGGRWRQPHTALSLKPGERREYAFRLEPAANYDEVRSRIAGAGLVDVEVAPGMTVPSDLTTTLALRSRNPVTALEAEHPGQTSIEALGRRGEYQLYRVRFARLGENLLTVKQRDGRRTRLEFFSTEPLETLIRKRGAFLVKYQQRGADLWYRGLLSEWNMESQVALSPDNYDRIEGWRRYEVTCDDPGLGKPAFLASKIAEYPVQAEVDALDEYMEHFVWGGLQRTTEESDSYGIYGIIDWKRNRESADPGAKGRRHLWRPYDYPHIVVMYWGMYRAVRDFPGLRTRLTREHYLERAYGTALALFTVPKRIVGWEAYETGMYNEVVLPELIDELERVGQADKARTLRTEWEKKVRYFVTGGPDLFGSEYAFDSTGFESTQALARYALRRTAQGTIELPAPDSLAREGAPALAPVTAAQAKAFAETQMRANLFCRGVVEKAYYLYGSDLRADGGDSYTLSYMSQMGGWAVMDHALHEAVVPDASVRLGCASFLSAWALMNTGTAESNYGYWFPGQANDGGAGGGFEPAAMGRTWLGQPHHRGSWYYSSEEDLGFCGALRAARTVLADDDLFGPFCFCGTFSVDAGSYLVEPRDGVRRRFSVRLQGQAFDLEVTGARFAPGKSLRWSPSASTLVLPLEREGVAGKTARLVVHGVGRFELQHEGGIEVGGDDRPVDLPLGLSVGEVTLRITKAKISSTDVP